MTVDVRDFAQAESLVDLARARGGPHILVNNAGGWTPGRQYPEASRREWSATLTLNLTAPMLLSQLVLTPMRNLGGGAVVNVASSAGVVLGLIRDGRSGSVVEMQGGEKPHLHVPPER